MTDFNASALQSFRNFQPVTENTMAKVDGGNVVGKGEYSGILSSIGRSKTEQAENNAVRTQLLQSLGKAFGIEGMSEEGGKVKFSSEFMNKLEQLLGPKVFKKSDFGVSGTNGEVTGGHPLTGRRISAIMKQVAIIGKGDFTTADYKAKLDFIKPQLEKLPEENRNQVKEHFNKVGAMLDFLENRLTDDLIEPNWEWETANEREQQSIPKWAMHEPGKAQQPLATKNPLNDMLFKEENGGMLVHLENIPRLEEIDDPKVITNYIRNAMQQFVKTSCDLWLDTADKPEIRDKFTKLLGTLSGCMEMRTTKLATFTLENNLIGGDIKQVAADHSKDMSLEKCIGKEIEAWMLNHPDKSEWEDMVEGITANLKGLKRPMVKVTGDDNSGYKFEPIMENGKPLVREITAEDVALVGKATYFEVFYGG